MFKKLLAFAAVASMAISANAEMVVDAYTDYQDWTSYPFYVMGYIPSFENGAMVCQSPHYKYVNANDATAEDIEASTGIQNLNGQDHYIIPTEEANWYQYNMMQDFASAVGTTYEVTALVKASEESDMTLQIRNGWTSSKGVQIHITTEWEEQTVYVEEWDGANFTITGQCGGNDVKYEWKWLKVSHNEKPSTTEWIEHLVNGDAEGEYGEVVCAQSKISDGDITPCEIVDDGGNKVFIVRAGSVEGRDDDARAWANQFWICSEKSWNTGDQFRISFRYKATNVANTNTQGHHAPGEYLIWHCLGDVKFTTEWQEYSKVITVESDMDGMETIAFNLNADVQVATDFYFDDIKWETMKLDEGYFIAGDFNDNDLDNAVEMIYDDEEAGHVAIVGSEAKPASKLKISKVRGNDSAFNSNTIAPDTGGEELVDGGVYPFVKKGAATIILPYGANWKVVLYEEYEMIMFEDVTSGIKFVSADNNAPVRYYNIQGVEVQNPVAGQLYIVKAGNKTFKAILR